MRVSLIAHMTLLALLLHGCGARHEEAKEADLDASVMDLSQKVNVLCLQLQASDLAPNLSEMDVQDFCSTAKAPRSLQDTETLGFNKVEIKRIDFGTGDTVTSLNVFTDFWLGEKLLDIVGKFKKFIDDPEAFKKPEEKKDQLLEVEIADDIQVDKEKKHVHLKASIKSTREKNGFLSIANDLSINAKLVDGKYIVLSVESVGVTPVSSSLFRGLKIVVLVLPHAHDFYFALHARIDLHSYGPGVDRKTKNIILGGVQDALQKIPELLNELE